MDAVEFIKAQNRMCSHYNSCDGCPFEEGGCGSYDMVKYPEEAVGKVEEWIKAHPLKTNADKIEEITGTEISVEADNNFYFIRIKTDGNTEHGVAKLKEWLESEYVEK